jgi:hypothetical protein
MKRLALAAAAVALMSTPAHAGTIFFQDFSNGLKGNEAVGGLFGVKDGELGHTSSLYYSNWEYSFYDLALDLTGVTEAALSFDYRISTELGYDGFNVLASTVRAPTSAADLLYPVTPGFYGAMRNNLSGLGSVAASGLKSGSVIFDLAQFSGRVVNLRFQFASDYAVYAPGVRLDNLHVTGVASAAPEPGVWALMMLGVGLAGAALRQRRSAAEGFRVA